MLKLRLIKGRSYTGYGVKATNMKPIVETEKKEISDALVASGYFSFVGEIKNVDEDAAGGKSLDKMTEKELDSYAAENGIDLSGLSKKAEKLAKIQQTVNEEGDNELIFDEE